MISPNVETFIGCDSSYRAADIVLYGAPFDSTTSYRPGARFGPSAIRHESFGLETYSPYQNADLTDFDVFDSGDLELCFGSSEAALADIEARAAEILGVAHEWLGFHDTGYHEGPPESWDLPAGSFGVIDPDLEIEALVRVVRRYRPHVMTTYDVTGGYPHPDHIRCHVVSVLGKAVSAEG